MADGLRFRIDLSGWASRPDWYTVAYILPFLDALVAVNIVYLKTHPGTPSILDPLSEVVYTREEGTEIWQDIPTILKRRKADCEDLAAALCAELRVKGISARIRITAINRPAGGRLFHITVRTPHRVYDPSKLLGMRGNG